jgi:hypothetical protein
VSEPRDLGELIGDDVSESELPALRRVDALLRSVPGPPAEIPSSLTQAVKSTAQRPARLRTRKRTAAVLAFAASLAAISFGLGTWARGDGFDERAAIPMQATADADGASALIRMGKPDESGNWPLRLEVKGLEPLPKGGYYLLWLAQDGDYGVACGNFRITGGEAEVEWDVSYNLDDYDEWVITAYRPDDPEDMERPWLLSAEVQL